MNENTSQKTLDDVILAFLVKRGFVKNARGTKYYKEVIKNIILFLQKAPDDKAISSLIEELDNRYSQFYLAVAQDYVMPGGLGSMWNQIDSSVKKDNESFDKQDIDYKDYAFAFAKQIFDSIAIGDIYIFEPKKKKRIRTIENN